MSACNLIQRDNLRDDGSLPPSLKRLIDVARKPAAGRPVAQARLRRSSVSQHIGMKLRIVVGSGRECLPHIVLHSTHRWAQIAILLTREGA